MDKMQMAHEYMQNTLNLLRKHDIPYDFESLIEESFEYADAMQAEADKRNNTERPKVLFEPKPIDEWQPDWSQAPDDATAWEYLGHGTARWHTTKKGAFRGADLFGYSGVGMFLVERPHGL